MWHLIKKSFICLTLEAYASFINIDYLKSRDYSLFLRNNYILKPQELF
jgi:hypothetical protein